MGAIATTSGGVAWALGYTDGEQTPVYSMSFELFENGVSRALVLDYNDFVISGALGKFDVKDSRPCK